MESVYYSRRHLLDLNRYAQQFNCLAAVYFWMNSHFVCGNVGKIAGNLEEFDMFTKFYMYILTKKIII